MIFRQLFEAESSTYTYLLGCEQTGECLLLDPVVETMERDLDAVQQLGLKLTTTLETHIHADHVSSACRLRGLTGSKIAVPAMERLECADIAVAEDQPLSVGTMTLRPLFTPGHTDSHHSYLLERGELVLLFSGDALLIDGCGRTDFQNGDAGTLYRSVKEKIFSLPDDTLVYPAHDYEHRHVSTVAQERERNPRLGAGKDMDDFVEIMANLGLPYPAKMDVAVPANRRCGECYSDAPEQVEQRPGKAKQG
jgi:glyoxylase-like metal-dependent hydrolase (beta-lactamase superfamily II)